MPVAWMQTDRVNPSQDVIIVNHRLVDLFELQDIG